MGYSQKKGSQKKVNTSIYTHWINGIIVFKKSRFTTILKKLERRHNFSIINHNQTLAKQTFTATFTDESIEQILKCFQKNHPFTYKIEQQTITIN